MEWSLVNSCACGLLPPDDELSKFCLIEYDDVCDTVLFDAGAVLFGLLFEWSRTDVPTNSSLPHVVFFRRARNTSATGDIKFVGGMIWS